MKNPGTGWLYVIIFSFTLVSFGQEVRRNTGNMIDVKNEFYDNLVKSSDEFLKKPKKEDFKFKMDFTGMDLPTSVSEYNTFWHHPPISQGISGMCWCFCTTSYYETEIYRLTKRTIKLSEIYTVYWEYVEKARRFVRERGDSEFGEGSESNAVKRIWKKYGIVPAEAYTGLKQGQMYHDHRQMFKEMDTYLKYVKENNLWNEDVVLNTIKTILNHYLGEPPNQVMVDGKKMGPLGYLEKIVRLNLDDYIDFLSLMEKPYFQKVEFPVPDNWWHNSDYHNLPVDDFVNLIKKAVRSNYSVCIGGDVSEAGYDSHAEVAMVPSFDIPADYIDQHARQFRFSNKTTEDDHGIHVVGYLERDGIDWYLIKDSGSGSRNGQNVGYYFYHEDYVKLKMLSFMVHRDVATDILKKFSQAGN